MKWQKNTTHLVTYYKKQRIQPYRHIDDLYFLDLPFELGEA